MILLNLKTTQGVFMKATAILLAILFIAGCTSREKGMPLEKGTPNYTLAEKLSAKVPELDPDKNQVLATTSTFELTVGDVIDEFVIPIKN